MVSKVTASNTGAVCVFSKIIIHISFKYKERSSALSEKNMKLSDYHSLLKKIKEIQMKEEYIPSIEDLKKIAETDFHKSRFYRN